MPLWIVVDLYFLPAIIAVAREFGFLVEIKLFRSAYADEAVKILTAHLTATALYWGGQCGLVRTHCPTIPLGLDAGGPFSAYLSRRERGFDSRWDHQFGLRT